MKKIFFSALLLLIATQARGNHIIVPDDQSTIKLGLQAATTAGDTVLVKAGTYADANGQVGRVDWKADNVVLKDYGDGDVIVTQSVAGSYCLQTSYSGITRRGCRVEGITFKSVATGGSAYPVYVWEGCTDFSFKDCTFDGYPAIWQNDATGTTSSVSFDGCTFKSSTSAMGGGAFNRQVGLAYDWTFTNCTFDYSSHTITAYAPTEVLEARGAHWWTFTDCVFKLPDYANNGNTCYGVEFRGDGTSKVSIGITMTGCTFIAQASSGTSAHMKTVLFGRPSADATSVVDSVAFRFNAIELPPDESGSNTYYGVEIETPDLPSTFSHWGDFSYNTIVGGDIGISLAESSYGCTVVGNVIRNAETGILLQDARYCEVTGNKIYGGVKAIRIGNGSTTALENYGHVVIGNYANGSDYLAFVTVGQDSGLTFCGNVGENFGVNWASYATVLSLSGWQALGAFPAGIVPAGLGSYELDAGGASDGMVRLRAASEESRIGSGQQGIR